MEVDSAGNIHVEQMALLVFRDRVPVPRHHRCCVKHVAVVQFRNAPTDERDMVFLGFFRQHGDGRTLHGVHL